MDKPEHRTFNSELRTHTSQSKKVYISRLER